MERKHKMKYLLALSMLASAAGCTKKEGIPSLYNPESVTTYINGELVDSVERMSELLSGTEYKKGCPAEDRVVVTQEQQGPSYIVKDGVFTVMGDVVQHNEYTYCKKR